MSPFTLGVLEGIVLPGAAQGDLALCTSVLFLKSDPMHLLCMALLLLCTQQCRAGPHVHVRQV